MNARKLLILAAGMGLAGALQAQTQSPPPVETQVPPAPLPQTSPTEGTAADTTPPGQTPTRQEPVPPPTVNPAPQTSPAEGTAVDTTPPGQTATPGAGTSAGSTAGTQAQSTSPSQSSSPTRMAAAGGGAGFGQFHVSKLIGMEVQTRDGTKIGQVQDVLMDASGRVTHALVSRTGGGGSELVAVPWDAVSEMMSGSSLVIERMPPGSPSTSPQ